MNRREIIETLKDMLDETGLGHCSNQPECIAINAAIDAINQFAEDNNAPTKQPGLEWVKTTDRLPTEADADNTMCWVLATTISSNLPMPEPIAYIRANPDRYPYWMPIQPLPEVEE